MQRCRSRLGQTNSAWLTFLASAVLLAALIGVLVWKPGDDSTQAREALVVYCAASMKAPVEIIAREYEKAYGVPVQLQYGGSQTLLANIEVSKRGDLYLPADDSYIQLAREKALLDETIALARMTPVLAVKKGNPKQISSLDDLLQRDVRIAQANPDAAAIGKLTRDLLGKTGQWEALKQRTTVFKPTVNDVANDIKVGTVDVGVVWDVTIFQYPELEMVHIPQFSGVTANISLGVLRTSSRPTAALRFARYVAAPDRGLKEFQRYGFQPVDGDRGSELPEIRLLAGAMLWAVHETVSAFEQREGVRVFRV